MRSLAFRIGGIPVKVDPTFWIIMGLFGLSRAGVAGGFDWVLAVEWVAMVFIGILVHELGHAVAFRSFGRPPSVVLYGLGGLTSAPGRLTPGRRLVATLAGPGVGFLLGGLVLALRAAGIWDPPRLADLGTWELARAMLAPPGSLELAELVLLDALFINIGWGLLNLVPLYPLDGGQATEALLSLLRVPRAEQLTSALGLAIAAVGAWWALQVNAIFLLLIMVFLGLTNLRRLRSPRPGTVPPQPDAGAADTPGPQLQHAMALAEQALQQGRPDQAVEVMRQEHAYRPTPLSARMYAAILSRTRAYDDLEALVAADRGHLGPDGLTSAAAALVAGGRYEVALRAAESAWSQAADGEWRPAVAAAAARAGLRDVDGAVRWLYTAADRGWDDRRRLESDPVFAEVRADPRLPDLLARMGA